jgi:hypothetical protein
MDNIASFRGIAPYLKDPLVLIGFFLFLAFLLSRYLIKQGIVPPLPEALGYRILRLILLYGFILGLLVTVLGFALKRQELINQQRAEASLIMLLRDALSNTSSLSEEEKNKIINQALEVYRSGALSGERIVEVVEQIKYTSTQNPNHSPEFRQAVNQLNSGRGIEATSTGHISPTTAAADGSTTETKRSVEAAPGTGTQYLTSPTQNTHTYSSPGNEIRSTVVLISPSGAASQTCAVRIDAPENNSTINTRQDKILWSVRSDGSLNPYSSPSPEDTVVKGSVKLSPDCHCHLWVLVRNRRPSKLAVESYWWPQGEASIGMEGAWQIPITFGGPNELGDFEIAAMVVDEQTSKGLETLVKTNASLAKLPNIVSGCSLETVSISKRLSG